ncbi:MAG: S8 family serine peptidase, partial [Pseudomonadota bacterium]
MSGTPLDDALATIDPAAGHLESGDDQPLALTDGGSQEDDQSSDPSVIFLEPAAEEETQQTSEHETDEDTAEGSDDDDEATFSLDPPQAISSNSVKDATGGLENTIGGLASTDAPDVLSPGISPGVDDTTITTQPITDPAEFTIRLQKLGNASAEPLVSVSVAEALSDRFREIFTDFEPLQLNAALPETSADALDYRKIVVKFGSTLAEMALGLDDGEGLDLLTPGSDDSIVTNSVTSSPLDALTAGGQSDAVIIDGKVVVDMSSNDGNIESLRAQMEALGMTDTAVWGNTLSGLLPIDAIQPAAEVSNLAFARPTAFITNVGSVDSQGDAAQGSDDARTNFGLDGSGQTVGILSDSYNSLGGDAAGVATGDLPGAGNTNNSTPVLVLEDFLASGGSDEGRAMAEIVHDVAPGANIQFHTAFLGAANFAQGIQDLIDAGSTVVVDDIAILTEPFFQDGAVAQSADQAVERGIPYFSSAGNSGTRSVEDTFRPSGTTVTYVNGSGQTVTAELHDWDSGAAVDTGQSITIGSGQLSNLTFQWDDPFNSVSNTGQPIGDYDLLILSPDGTVFSALSGVGSNSNSSGDPLERFIIRDDGSSPTGTTFDLAIARVDGTTTNNLFKYISFNAALTFNEYTPDAPTSFGHPNAQFAQGVAAVDFIQTAEFQSEFSSRGFPFPTPVVQDFSSLGGVDILFDENGNRLATPEQRQGVDIAGPDGANTTFFGSGDRSILLPTVGGTVDLEPDAFPNFFGTSAAAPHVAALAALMREQNEAATPHEIFDALADTAVDVQFREGAFINTPTAIPNGVGVDDFTGAGFVNATAALTQITPSIIITEIMYDP